MKRTKQDYLNLLDETVKYYSEDTSRRALNNGACTYLTKDGKMCAVGRCINQKDFNYDLLNSGFSVKSVASYLASNGATFDSVMMKQYRGYDIKFWQKLQDVHDFTVNWDKNGLTEDGKEHIETLIMSINDNNFN